MKGIEDEPLSPENVAQVVCSPGGLEVQGKAFHGETERTCEWRVEMLKLGMWGFVSYEEGEPRGFVEAMPAEVAPVPIEAPGAAVLLCYHWVPKGGTDPEEHLAQERRLVERMVSSARRRFAGIATLGWDHPSHFPIEFLRDVGFVELERTDYLALMWHPLRKRAREPVLAPVTLRPQDVSVEGCLAVDSGWSRRCPYSIDHAARARKVLDGFAGEERIRYTSYRIDTHEEALRTAISPWDWDFLFVNRKQVAFHDLGKEGLGRLIASKLAELGEEGRQ